MSKDRGRKEPVAPAGIEGLQVVICHQFVSDDASADELDVLSQVRLVEAGLRRLGHRPSVLPISLNLQAAAVELQKRKPDLVMNFVESLHDRGELIAAFPSLLDSLELPFSGASADALYLTSNKLLARQRLQMLDLPVASGAAVEGEDLFIVKSVWEHASRGLDQDSIVPPQRVRAEIESREARFGGRFFAEAYLPGREFNVSLLDGPSGAQVLPIAEMTFEGFEEGAARIVGYSAKWDADSAEYAGTIRRFLLSGEDALRRRLADLALSCWSGFGLTGYARVDFRVAGDKVIIIDINANPCFAPDSGFAAAVTQAGLSHDEALARIIDAGFSRRSHSRAEG